jgi:hypothetical protein
MNRTRTAPRNRPKWMASLAERMAQAFAERDPQKAADIIGEAKTNSEQMNAMLAAEAAGFRPYFYVHDIRVSLPNEEQP